MSEKQIGTAAKLINPANGIEFETKTWTKQNLEHIVKQTLGVLKFWLKPIPKFGFTKIWNMF